MLNHHLYKGNRLEICIINANNLLSTTDEQVNAYVVVKLLKKDKNDQTKLYKDTESQDNDENEDEDDDNTIQAQEEFSKKKKKKKKKKTSFSS